MTNKKPVRKAGLSTAKAPAPATKPVIRKPATKKPASVQPSAPKPVATHQPARQTASPRILNETASRTPPPAPVAKQPAPAKAPVQEISGEELYNRIQFEAYLLGEKDGFKADPVHYWIQAERAVKAMFHHQA